MSARARRLSRLVGAAAVLGALPAVRLAAQTPATIRPGMTEAEVRAAWGAPVASRTRGDFGYLFYDNGCLKRCGTYDVVLLQGGQVVDAVVRGAGHHYDGVSSSPPDRAPRYTPPTHDSSARSKEGPR
jgi:hypothetical protein